MHPLTKDITGQKFGRLTVLDISHSKKITYWRVQCDCGKIKIIEGKSLRLGRTVSCGCYHKDKLRQMLTKHGHAKGSGSRVYEVWEGMKQRCLNINNARYQDYGGRGIRVCERWMKFENFLADMGERPKGTSIDRINNDGNYEPGNCRWATRKEQQNNLRNNVRITYKGTTKTFNEWAEIMGIKRHTLYTRYKRGWPIDKIFKGEALEEAEVVEIL